MNWLALFFHLVKAEESSVFFNNFGKHKSQYVPLWSNVSIWKEDWPDFPQSSQNSLTISTPSSSKSSPLYLSASETFAKQVRAVKYFAWRLSRSLMQSRISKVSFLAQSSSFCTCLPCRSPPCYLATSPSFFIAVFNCFCLGPLSLSSRGSFYWLSSDFYWLSTDFLVTSTDFLMTFTDFLGASTIKKVVRIPTTSWLDFKPVVGNPTSGWKSTYGGWISNHCP